MKKTFKYKELTGEILDSAFTVHNSLGCGFLEKVYENALYIELGLRGYKIQKQKKILIRYRGKIVGEYISDIIVEVKCVDEIINIHKVQLLNYLRASKIEGGFIINFFRPKLEFQRLVV